MIVHPVQNATHVRNNWSEFIDDVVRKGPQFLKRNRDELATFSKEQLEIAFGSYSFHAKQFTEEDRSITLSIPDFGIIANGDTKEEALNDLVKFLFDYAQEYIADFTLYSKDPMIREHFPYIMNVLIQDNMDEVKALIKCLPGEK